MTSIFIGAGLLSCGDNIKLTRLSGGVVSSNIAQGVLDTTFNSPNGFANLNNPGSIGGGGPYQDGGRSIALDSSGRILVGGFTDDSILGSGSNILVSRLTSSGALDTTYGGGDGSYTIATHTAQGYDIAIDNSNRVLIAGFRFDGGFPGNHRAFLTRLTTTGVVDGTFNGGVPLDIDTTPSENDFGISVDVDSLGGIYLAGYTSNSANENIVIQKYTNAGTLDNTFSGDGIDIYNNGGQEKAEKVSIDSSNRPVIVGAVNAGANLIVMRYTTAGVLDTTFDTDGIQNSQAGYGYDLVFDSSGNIFVVGKKTNATVDMAIWKFTPTGALDTSFGGGAGFITHDNAAGGAAGVDEGRSISIDSQGNLVVTGRSHNGTNQDAVIWRYTSSGVLDTTFGAGAGYVIFDGTGVDIMEDHVIDSSGKIIGAGSITVGNSNVGVWRYE